MKNAFRDYICFTDMQNIESLNQQMKESFLFKENEIKDENEYWEDSAWKLEIK